MTQKEAKERAEEIVFVYSNLCDIFRRCDMAGIPTHTKKGKPRSRTELEEELITHYTKLYTTE